MKISTLEKWILGLTAAFLLLTVGFFLGQRMKTEPYTVSANTLWISQVGENKETLPAPVKPVNINTANVDELRTLPGIGQVRAEEIIADREANGSFRIPEDITRVSGIGQGTLEEILDYIVVE